MSEIDQVDPMTLPGMLRFYSKFLGEIPPIVCAKAADRIEELEAALSAMVDRWEPDCSGSDRAMWEAAVAVLPARGEK